MQLVDVDPVEAKSLQAAFQRLAQVGWGGIVGPLVRPRAIPSTLGRDDKVTGIRRQRFGDQRFADIRSIRISSVDKIDAKLNSSAKNGYCRRSILRWTPDSVARRRIAPKPRRLTVSSSPRVIVPALAADSVVAFMVFSFIFTLKMLFLYRSEEHT